MRKKIIIISICLFLITTNFLVIGQTQENQDSEQNYENFYYNGDELDQYQNISDDIMGGTCGPAWHAQSFVPTKTITSKIAIFIVRYNSPNQLYVGIKYDLDGPVIVSTFKYPNYIPETPSWVVFDIPDVYTPLDKPCYIVITEEGFTPGNNSYKIFGSKLNDVYLSGSAYKSHDNEGKSWEKRYGDLAFKTYVNGMDTPPNPPSISGPTTVKAGEEVVYTFNAVDPEGDPVKYVINWGDDAPFGNTSNTHFYDSGEDVQVSHKYLWALGTFTISATAIDKYWAESDCGTFEVTIIKKDKNLEYQQTAPQSSEQYYATTTSEQSVSSSQQNI